MGDNVCLHGCDAFERLKVLDIRPDLRLYVRGIIFEAESVGTYFTQILVAITRLCCCDPRYKSAIVYEFDKKATLRVEDERPKSALG